MTPTELANDTITQLDNAIANYEMASRENHDLQTELNSERATMTEQRDATIKERDLLRSKLSNFPESKSNGSDPNDLIGLYLTREDWIEKLNSERAKKEAWRALAHSCTNNWPWLITFSEIKSELDALRALGEIE